MDNDTISAEALKPIQTLNSAWQNLIGHWQDYAIRLLAAGIIILVGCIVLRFGRRLILKICSQTGKRVRKRTPEQNKTIQSIGD